MTVLYTTVLKRSHETKNAGMFTVCHSEDVKDIKSNDSSAYCKNMTIKTGVLAVCHP